MVSQALVQLYSQFIDRYRPCLPTTVKGLLLIVTVWTFGYLGLSLAWPCFGLFVYITQLRYFSSKNGNGSIGHRKGSGDSMEDSLVGCPDVFPDKERCEWLNRIVAQAWPFLDDFIDKFSSDLEPKLIEALPEYLKSFRFEKVNLGSSPIRVGAIKCYDGISSPNEIVVEADICYEGNCEFEVVIRGLKAGIKNIRITGVLRIELKPLLKHLPIVGGVNLYFLARPSLQFELSDLAELLDVPMVNDLLTETVLDQLSQHIVLPNKLSIQLSSSIDRELLRAVRPVGVLRFELFGARKLRRSDFSLLGIGKSDPYATVVIQGHSYRTRTVKNRVNPKWDFAVEVPIYLVRGQQVIIEVMDEDTVGKDDWLGRCTIPLSQFERAGQMEGWIDLMDTDSGSIHYKGAWLTLSDEAGSLVKHFEQIDYFSKRYPLDQRQPDQPIASVGLVSIYLDQIVSGLVELDEGRLENYQLHVTIGQDERRSKHFAVDGDQKLEDNFQFLLDGLDRIIKLELFGSEQRKSLAHGELSTCELLESPEMEFHNDIALKVNSKNMEPGAEMSGVMVSAHVVPRLLKEPGPVDELNVSKEDLAEVKEEPGLGEKMLRTIKETCRRHTKSENVTAGGSRRASLDKGDRRSSDGDRALVAPVISVERIGDRRFSGGEAQLSLKKPITPSAADSHESLFVKRAADTIANDEKNP